MTFTRQGITAGKHDVEQHGHDRVVKDRLTLDTYATGGIDFDPYIVYGFSRVTHVDVSLVGDSSLLARFDPDADSIRVFDMGDGTEPADGDPLGEDVVVRIEGRGGG